MGTTRIRRMTTTVVVEDEDQDVILPSDVDSADIEIDVEEQPRQRRHRSRGGGDVDVDDADSPGDPSGRLLEGVEASRWAPAGTTSNTGTNRTNPTQGRPLRGGNGGPNAASPSRRTTSGPVPAVAFGRTLPTNDETPTRPRTRGIRRR